MRSALTWTGQSPPTGGWKLGHYNKTQQLNRWTVEILIWNRFETWYPDKNYFLPPKRKLQFIKLYLASLLLPDKNFEGPWVHVSDGDGGVVTVVGQGTLQHCPEHRRPRGQHLPCGLYPLCAGGQPNLSEGFKVENNKKKSVENSTLRRGDWFPANFLKWQGVGGLGEGTSIMWNFQFSFL